MQHFIKLLLIFIVFIGSSQRLLAETTTPSDELSFSVIVTAQSGGALEAMVVDSGGWFTQRKLVHNAILIKHPKGDILWDSGIGTEVESQLDAFNFWEKELFKIENVQPAINQLNNANYPIDSITAIIPSHMHWDHVSALEDFKNVPVWVQKQERDAAEKGHAPAFVQSQFDSPDIKWKSIKLLDSPYLGFERSWDIYNDDSLVLVDMAGHTQGQLGLFVNIPNKGRYFLIGDTTWSLKGVNENKSRPNFVQWLTGVDHDKEQNAKVVNKVHQLSKQMPDLVIVPAHDEIVTAKLPNFPDFL
jgi:glyoxylase-like metal-dependent hydrolase (beta-lactamase superfamily II)